MPIDYKHGAEEVKALGAQAGKAQAAREGIQRRFQKDMAVMDYNMRIQAEQMSKDWELQKMVLKSQLDFAYLQKREGMRKELVLQEEDQALKKYLAAEKRIDGDDSLDDDTKGKLKHSVYLETVAGASSNLRLLAPEIYQSKGGMDPIEQLISGAMQEGAGGPTSGPTAGGMSNVEAQARAKAEGLTDPMEIAKRAVEIQTGQVSQPTQQDELASMQKELSQLNKSERQANTPSIVKYLQDLNSREFNIRPDYEAMHAKSIKTKKEKLEQQLSEARRRAEAREKTRLAK